jgi:hypothetical protein
MADDDLTAPLAGAVRALAGQRGPCPSPAALVEYESLPAPEQARHEIHDHVQVCARCQLVLLNLDEPAARPLSRWLLPLAAVLALAVLTPALYRALTPAPPVADTVRGTELQPVAPVGNVSAVSAFEWQSPIHALRYRVTVYRGAQSVWTTESGEMRVARPPALAIDPGVEYTWQADALDGEGTVRMSSPRTAFTLRR